MKFLVKKINNKIKQDIVLYTDLKDYEQYFKEGKPYALALLNVGTLSMLALLYGMCMNQNKDLGIYFGFIFWIVFFLKFMVEILLTLNLPKEAKEDIWRHYLNSKENDDPLKKYETIFNQFKNDPKQFCSSFFNKSGSGFVRFYQDRAWVGSELSTGFILYSLSIPRKKELSVDSLRKILLAYQPIKLNKILDLEFCFSKYSLNDLEVLFTNPYNRTYILKLTDQILPIEKDWISLENKLQSRLICPKVEKIHNQIINNYHFKLLLSKEDYELASKDFNNCLGQDYWVKPERVFTVHCGTQPIACLSIKNEQLLEVKAINNLPCMEKDELVSILKSKGLVK